MSAQLQKLTGSWTTDVLPTQTTLTHIDPTNIVGITETLYSLSSAYSTVTEKAELYSLARAAKGAMASLKVVSAQHYIATATNTQELPEMTQVIWNATMELQDLEMGFNLYQMKLSLSANAIFAAVFAVLFLSHVSLSALKKYLYFGLCLCAGTGLELAGYTARIVSINDFSAQAPFLCQIISLTLAPAFIMAGVYYLLAQLLVIYGRQYARLKPLWFTYIFVVCDITSLVIQAAGGAMTAMSLQKLESTKPGTYIMLGGICFQVVSMTLFSWLLCDFLWRIYFRASPDVKFSVRNLFALLFQTPRGRQLQCSHLYEAYNQKYYSVYTKPRFGLYPLAILGSVFFIYVRCVYRVVELSEGWTGYLITHEEYVMTLDALQVLLTCVLLAVFHPGLMIGQDVNVSMADIKNNQDEDVLGMRYDQSYDEKQWDTSSSSDSSEQLERERQWQDPQREMERQHEMERQRQEMYRKIREMERQNAERVQLQQEQQRSSSRELHSPRQSPREMHSPRQSSREMQQIPREQSSRHESQPVEVPEQILEHQELHFEQSPKQDIHRQESSKSDRRWRHSRFSSQTSIDDFEIVTVPYQTAVPRAEPVYGVQNTQVGETGVTA